MWCKFVFMGIGPTFDQYIREKPLYHVWLANPEGSQVMEYLCEEEKLEEFCALIDDLDIKRMADASQAL